MPWATEQDVVTLTGIPVGVDVLEQAQAVIELKIGRTEALATAEMSTADLEWLRRAVAYQAAWQSGQPDLHTRLDVTQLSQDGMAATFQGDALTIAPLAKRAIARLSFRSSIRSIPVAPFEPDVRRGYPVLAPGEPIVDYEGEAWKRI